jgi:DNA-binding MarR family transcriptional regulator
LARQANLTGALATALTDRLNDSLRRGGERGLSGAAALVHVHSRPGQTIDFLARVLRISHPAAVRVVDRLEADGLVKRRPGPDDRSLALFLTPRGELAARAALEARLEVLAQTLAPLTSEEQEQLEPLLEKLLAGLTEDRWSARHLCRLCDFPVCENPSCPVDRAAAATEHP